MDSTSSRRGGSRPNSGGARPGAGRPRQDAYADDDPLQRVTVYLTARQIGAMVRIGGGSLSSAIRQVIEESGYVL